MKSRLLFTAVMLAFLLGGAACAGSTNPAMEPTPAVPTPETEEAQDVNLSPAVWDPAELAQYEALNAFSPGEVRAAGGQAGLVTGTIAAPAVRAGLEALRQGGSAADAALTTALAQVALTPGNFITYAGLMTMVYYDAESGRLHSMNAAYNIPQGEGDPLSIPAAGSGVPSGRATLVPGFMPGVEAAHERFGRLPFAALFDPAIYFAKEGFLLDPFHAETIEIFRATLSRRPETRQLFTRDDGNFYQAGDRFRQPALADTLRAVADQGVEYMVSGPWAEKFVAAVQEEGGTITLADLADYEVIWSEPLRVSYGDYEIASPGLPAVGGVNLVEGFNLLEAANWREMGPYTESPEALFWLMQISRAYGLSHYSTEELAQLVPGRDLSPQSRLSKETAGWLWEQMAAGSFFLATPPGDKDDTHSAAVVAVDRWGNVAALVHSINALFWGDTGIFVDGVAIPDSAAHQRRQVAQAGPGNRLPDPTNPLIVLKDGKPVLASASIGDVHRETMQRLVNILDYSLVSQGLVSQGLVSQGLDPQAALEAPSFMNLAVQQGDKFVERVAAGQFAAGLLEDVRVMGQPVEEVNLSPYEQVLSRGYWIGIAIDPQTGQLSGAAPADFGGTGAGY